MQQSYHEALLYANPPVIEPKGRLTEFCNRVFANLDELRLHAGRLSEALVARQKEQSPLVHGVGDLILDAALEWGTAYTEYMESMAIGEQMFEQEKARNPAFRAFLQVGLTGVSRLGRGGRVALKCHGICV